MPTTKESINGRHRAGAAAVLDGSRRYELVTEEKAGGATYTPQPLADFVAAQIVRFAPERLLLKSAIRVLDPAVGEGALLSSLLEHLPDLRRAEVFGFDTDEQALRRSESLLTSHLPKNRVHLQRGDFLKHALDVRGPVPPGGLFPRSASNNMYDLVIANPPYVRTQVMGAEQAKRLAAHFGLSGRVDLYHAFILAIAEVLAPNGVAGIILSNRFMTTQAGAAVRRAIRTSLALQHVWDLGDTKLFEAAVLPAVVVAAGIEAPRNDVGFTSIYQTSAVPSSKADSVVAALPKSGCVKVPDGRVFRVQQAKLDDSHGESGVWRGATASSRAWLRTISENTWRTFGDLGKIRVGVKTCADRVFIGTHWAEMAPRERPELLRPLATHHLARRYRPLAIEPRWHVLYPHESMNGRRRPVELPRFPKSRAYLEQHRETLAGRQYVVDAGRKWYEIWVPQDPAEWGRPKLVFRDISERPCFWMDEDGSVVNGDCYWLTTHRDEDERLLWLALAVANSSFIERFYDERFNNKLYAGRRRFITQYVTHFPLPDPSRPESKRLVNAAQTAFHAAGTPEGDRVEAEVEQLVWAAFGLGVEEVPR